MAPTSTAHKNRRKKTSRRSDDQAVKLEQRLEHLLESTKAVPWEADAGSFMFTYAGPQVVRLLGYPPEAWYEKDFWVEHIHPDDRETAVDLRLKKSRRSTEYESQYRMIAKDGRIVWLHDIVKVERSDGFPKTLRGFLLDITERKVAAARAKVMMSLFQDLYELAPDIYLSIDVATAKVTRCNETAARQLGYTKEDLIGRSWSSLYHPDCVSQAKQVFQSFLEAGIMQDAELRLLRKDGSAIDVSLSMSAIRDAHGRIVATRSICRDITRRKQIERESHDRLQELAHACRVSAMGELTASLAHEVRQPLTAILSNAQAAEHFLSAERPDLQELREILADIVKDDRRAGEVIQRIRTLLHKEAGTKVEVLNLNQVIADVIPLVRSDAIIKGVRIVTEFDSHLSTVRGDRVQLQQVILNLLLNGAEAMKNCRPDDRSLVVRTAQHNPESPIVSIQDCGIGVTEENLEQVFTPFYTTKAQGMGMGLSIARSIIELYNGRLWATRNPNRGATFSFILPVAKAGEA